LATPPIWFLLTKVCEVFSGAKHIASNLPEEPFWYLLAALVIFGMRYLKKPEAFWEKSEYFLIVISGCCLMIACWLMAIGQPSLLAVIALPRHAWALALLFVSAILLWCAKHMTDTLFGICSLIGVASGIYTFISSYPWK
ncbi:MAG: hypothetical protein LBN33_02685, partial [Desulfovibrio sp.]|nr:hypothetical protein [Desulfovibrio sp.]